MDVWVDGRTPPASSQVAIDLDEVGRSVAGLVDDDRAVAIVVVESRLETVEPKRVAMLSLVDLCPAALGAYVTLHVDFAQEAICSLGGSSLDAREGLCPSYPLCCPRDCSAPTPRGPCSAYPPWPIFRAPSPRPGAVEVWSDDLASRPSPSAATGAPKR